MNVWAPVLNPAYRNPLALLDSSTVDLDSDCVPYIVHPSIDTNYAYGAGHHPRPAEQRVPQAAKDAPALSPCFRERHRWVFLPDMRPEEAMIFKQFDFREQARSKATFHVAFHDPHHERDAERPGRKSIECRLLLMFDEPPQAKL